MPRMRTIANLVANITADTSGLHKELGKTQTGAQKWAKKMASSFSGFGAKAGKLLGKGLAIGAGAGIAALGSLTAAAAKFTLDAAPIEGVRNAFKGLAESSGQSMDIMLKKLQEGSAGMVAQADLMKTYNEAAQLVSTTFANQLPDAMTYLRKVAAATDQDMGAMLDSLVKGVGRLSPMILDNLGIQVSMTEAAELWAKSQGKAATEVVDNTRAISKENKAIAGLEKQLLLAQKRQSEFSDKTKESTRMAAEFRIEELTNKIWEHRSELERLRSTHGAVSTSTEALIKDMTKAQQQEAMMMLTMEKLRKNTEAMPDVLGSTAQSMATLKATVQDTKDAIGLAFMPVAEKVTGWLSEMASKWLPVVVAFVENKVVPAVQAFADVLALAFAGDYQEALSRMFPTEVVTKINEIASAITSFVQEQVIPFITEHAEALKAAFIGIAVVLGAAAIASTITGIAAAITTILNPITLIIVAVGLLAAAWMKDWGGIRTFVTELWSNTLQPAFEQIRLWLGENIPKAVTIVVATFEVVQAWLGEHIPKAIATLTEIWQNRLLPAFHAVAAFVQENIMPIFAALAEVGLAVVQKGSEALAGLWQNVLSPALHEIWSFIENDIMPAFNSWWGAMQKVAELIGQKLAPILSGFYENTLKPLGASFGNVAKNAKSIVDWLGQMATKVRSINLPDWLKPGSATPFELGIRGISMAMRDLAIIDLPILQASLAVAGGGGQTTTHDSHDSYSITIPVAGGAQEAAYTGVTQGLLAAKRAKGRAAR